LSEEDMAKMQKIIRDQLAAVKEKVVASENPTANESAPNPAGDPAVGNQQVLQEAMSAVKPKFTREAPPEEMEPAEKYADALKDRENQPEWGKGKDGYKRPKTPADKMRYVVILDRDI
jgi:hypothetical protein